MIQPGSYVRVRRTETYYYGCIFQVIEKLDSRYFDKYLVVNEFDRGSEHGNHITLDTIDDLELVVDLPEGMNLRDQPIYQRADEHFQTGDLVQVDLPSGESYKARVEKAYIGSWGVEQCLVRAIRVDGPEERIGTFSSIRWDWMTLLHRPDSQPEEFLTGVPIPEDMTTIKLFGTSRTQLGWISSETLCNTNYFGICECCGEVFLNSKMMTACGERVCYPCYCQHFTECDECGRTVRYEDTVTDDDDRVLCPACAESFGYSVNSNPIHQYSYKPVPIFHGHELNADPRSLFMGVELEVDGGDDRETCAKDMLAIENNKTDLFYMKYDGSLVNGGFEIVTHPCTLEYHQQSFPWKQIIYKALFYHFTSHKLGTCGLHVHVNRTALGDSVEEQDDTAAKIIILFDRFWDLFVRFSRRKRRSLENYAYAPNASITAADSKTNAIRKSKDACTDHYCAVNLSNRDTVEFRIFRGTLKYNTLMASLEMVSNVVSLAKSKTTEEIHDVTWEDIINVHRYPELVQYLTERNMPGADE